MNSHIDYSISPEAIYRRDVLVPTHEPATARSLKGADVQTKLGLKSAIDCLRDDLISLYVSAEEIHWHLRAERHDMGSWHAFADQAEVARQLSGYILRAIVHSVCIQEKNVREGDCDALLKAVLALQGENDALASPAVPLNSRNPFEKVVSNIGTTLA